MSLLDRQPPTTVQVALFSAKFSKSAVPLDPFAACASRDRLSSVKLRQAEVGGPGWDLALPEPAQPDPSGDLEPWPIFWCGLPVLEVPPTSGIQIWFLMEFGGRMKGDKGDRKGDGLREMPYFVRSLVGSVPVSKWPPETAFRLIAGSRSTIAVRSCRDPCLASWTPNFHD